MILLLLIGGLFIAYGIFKFLQAIYLLCLSIYYHLASDDAIDEGYKKHVIKESEEYKQFESNLDESIRNLIN